MFLLHVYVCFPDTCKIIKIKSPEHWIFAVISQGISWSIRGSYSAIWSLPFTNVIWHFYPLPVTVTSQPIMLSTNFMILILRLTFTELRVVSMEHLQRVWHASRESLPFRPPFWDMLMLQLLKPDFPILPRLFSTFLLEYPSVLSRFCLTYLWVYVRVSFDIPLNICKGQVWHTVLILAQSYLAETGENWGFVIISAIMN